MRLFFCSGVYFYFNFSLDHRCALDVAEYYSAEARGTSAYAEVCLCTRTTWWRLATMSSVDSSGSELAFFCFPSLSTLLLPALKISVLLETSISTPASI